MNKPATPRPPISRTVKLLGLTSFFTDVSSEMIYPLIQAFVSALLTNAQALIGPVLGIIEGIAEATASLIKVYAGNLSDRLGRRKGLTITGYGLSGASKLLFLLGSLGWGFILLARFTDRAGKGIRTAPRDALIAESVDAASKGRAYGFHRTMDYLGAVIGVLVCYAVSLRFLDPGTGRITNIDAFYTLFLISIIPAALGVITLFMVREKRKSAAIGAPRGRLTLSGLDSRLKLFLVAVFIFTLGNSSNQFLLLRSMDAGINLPDVLLMYLLFNLATSFLSTPLGILSDRIGRKRVIIAGYTLYAFIYTMFGFVTPGTSHWLWLFWILYGAYYALTEGIEKALVADLAPAERRGTVMGLFSTIVGISLLPASLIAGGLYAAVGSAAPFIFSGITSLAAMTILCFLRESAPERT